MNKNIQEFIESKLNIGVNKYEELMEMEVMRIAGFLILHSEDPFSFLKDSLIYIVESGRAQTLAHHFIQYCICSTPSAMNFWRKEALQEIYRISQFGRKEWVFEMLHKQTINYFSSEIENLFNQVKINYTGDYCYNPDPLDTGMNDSHFFRNGDR